MQTYCEKRLTAMIRGKHLEHAISLFVAAELALYRGYRQALAQLRVAPQASQRGVRFGEPWGAVPGSFCSLGVPDWRPPTDLPQWQVGRRPRIRQTILGLLKQFDTEAIYPPVPPRPVRQLSEMQTAMTECFGRHWENKR
ncbi:MAG: hypothetical protein SFU86_20250 [Pirellulaceae bacterium]|nr:hypothetical protein [Pirellulaceae bacterium]